LGELHAEVLAFKREAKALLKEHRELMRLVKP
jgi:hypothetical protein